MSEIFFGNGVEERIIHRIINGKPVNITDYPYYVFIDSKKCFCGGALLTVNVVLTAAHCVVKCPLNTIRVIPGLDRRNQSKKRTVHRAKKVIVHPRYEKDKDYDLALVILTEDVTLCSCVDTIEIGYCTPSVGERITVVGYGYTKCLRKNGRCVPTPSKYLRASERKIVRYDGPIMNTYSKETRTCLGDSGSPVVCNGELVAIHVGGEWFCGCTSYHVTLAHPRVRSFLIENVRWMSA